MTSAQQAQRDADQAARIAASAGKPRGTEKLLDAVASTPPTAIDTLDAEAKKGKSTGWIESQDAEKDLTKASQMISQAVKADLEKSVSSSIQAEAGAINLALAAERFKSVETKVEEIARRATQLQALAQLAVDLGSEGQAIAANVKPATSEAVDKAKAAIDTTKAAVTKAQAEVTRIEGEIKTRQDQAKEIYSRTEASFQAADNLKGKEAIDATNKSIEERKQGDALMAEAGNLEPQLAQARTDLAIAQVQAKDAEREVAAAQSAYDASNAWVKQNADRTASLQANAKKIMTDPKGAAEQFNELIKLVNELEPEIDSAASAAATAQSAYSKATNDYKAAMAALNAKTTDRGLESSDPAVKVSRDVRGTALLNWGQSAAAQQEGRIHAAGYNAATIAATLNNLMGKAYQAAGVPAAQVTLPPSNVHQKKASDAFNAAVAAAQAGNGLASEENNRIKWIGYGLEALANQGLALVDPTNAKTAMSNAKAAADKATAIQGAADHGNPDLIPQLRRAGIDVAG
jgi:hypothetical protein